MSDDGTSGYAPKSPDLSSFYSNPAPPASASAAPKGYDYDYDSNNTPNYLHTTRRGSYLQPPQRTPTSAWQPKTPASSSPTRATSSFPPQQQQQQQQQAYDQPQHAFPHQQQGSHPAPPPPQPPHHLQQQQQHPHYVPPSPSHHEYHPPQHAAYPYNPVQNVKHLPQVSLQQQQPQQQQYWAPTAAQSAPYPGHQPPAPGVNPYVQGHSHSHSQSSSTSTQPGLHEEHFASPTMPPRRAAAAAAAENMSSAAPEPSGPIVKTKFPTARIKRIMQADEEVGKVAQSTPIAVGKALEMFMIQLVTKSADQARQKGSKRVSAQMLKDVIEGDDQWDFLREIASKVEENEKKGRAAKNEGSDSEEEAPEGKRKGRGRKKKSG